MSLSHANMGSEPGLVASRRQYARDARVAASSTTDQKTHTRQGERRGATVGSPGLTVHAAGAPESLHQSLQHQSLRSAHLLGIASQIWCNMVRYILVSSFLLSFTSVM